MNLLEYLFEKTWTQTCYKYKLSFFRLQIPIDSQLREGKNTKMRRYSSWLKKRALPSTNINRIKK